MIMIMISSAILHLLGWPSWRSETCYREQTIESKTSYSSLINIKSVGCHDNGISGERDSQWAWSLARKLPSLSEDPRWPLDMTLLQEVAKLTSTLMKQNLALLLKVRVRGWMSQERVGHPPLLCLPRLEGQHLLQVDRIRWFNQRNFDVTKPT